MTTSGDGRQSDEGADEPAFDPYRYGRPDHPIPPEYAPPGYVPDPPASSPPPGAYPPPPTYPPSNYASPNYPPSNYPPPPNYSSYPAGSHGGPVGGTGKATTAMVLGILSIAFFWLTFLDLLLIVPAIVFGIIGVVESRSRGGAGRGKAVAGLVTAVIGAVAAIVFTVVALDAVEKCGGIDNRNESGFQQCLQDNL